VDLVQAMMIHPPQYGLEGLFDIEEVDDEPGLRVDITMQSELDPVGMAVQTVAPVLG
jgi:hypothetical protein